MELTGYFEGPIRVDPLIFLLACVVGKVGRNRTDTANDGAMKAALA